MIIECKNEEEVKDLDLICRSMDGDSGCVAKTLSGGFMIEIIYLSNGDEHDKTEWENEVKNSFETNFNFKKNDNNKNRLELIEPQFILGLGQVLTFGAEKYDAHNWKKASDPENIERIKGALLRHLMAYLGGEQNDPETKISHLHHCSCNLMFLNHFDNNNNMINNDKM